MDLIDEIIAYVMNTPGNTNPVILKQMILKAASSKTTEEDSKTPFDDGQKI